ncbi:MAG: hypothetical protein JOZ02_24295 [Acidobacteria bacterium]|nr:hypothetical protein [Acidobacteriota bacterium]
MNRANVFNGGARTALFAAALTLLLIPFGARAQHQGHEAHQHPAASATPTPSPSPTPMPMTMSMPAQGESHAGHEHGAQGTAGGGG